MPKLDPLFARTSDDLNPVPVSGLIHFGFVLFVILLHQSTHLPRCNACQIIIQNWIEAVANRPFILILLNKAANSSIRDCLGFREDRAHFSSQKVGTPALPTWLNARPRYARRTDRIWARFARVWHDPRENFDLAQTAS